MKLDKENKKGIFKGIGMIVAMTKGKSCCSKDEKNKTEE